MTHPFDWIEPYIDGDLAAEDARSFEAHLTACPDCRGQVDALRALIGRARSLPREIEPPADLWLKISPKLARPSRAPWLVALGGLGALAVAAMALLVLGAGVIAWLSRGPDVSGTVAEADAALRRGDLPGSAARYADAVAIAPDDRPALEGASYAAFLRGDYAEADRLLRVIGDDPDTLLRRALIAHAAGDLDSVRAHGERSGKPVGLVLAAEVYLADAEVVRAKQLLLPLAGRDDDVGHAAGAYLRMLDSPDRIVQNHAEITALWALGERRSACEAAVEAIPLMADDAERNQWALVWAGRAVTSGDPDGADVLLDAIDLPPPDQAWRVYATRGMVQIARGQDEEGIATFAALASAGAPGDGLADALVTAAALTRSPATAEVLAGSVEGVAASRALHAAGSPTWTAVAPQSGVYAQYARSKSQ